MTALRGGESNVQIMTLMFDIVMFVYNCTVQALP